MSVEDVYRLLADWFRIGRIGVVERTRCRRLRTARLHHPRGAEARQERGRLQGTPQLAASRWVDQRVSLVGTCCTRKYEVFSP